MIRRNAFSTVAATLAFSGLMVGFAPAVSADLIVDWGGNYVSNAAGNTDLLAGGFSGGEPTAISPAAPYGTFGTTSNTILGAIETQDSLINQFIVQNNGAADRLQFKSTTAQNGAALALWESSEFLGSPGSAVTLDNASTISLNVNTFAQVSGVRHVIRTASGYFISEGGTITGTGAQAAGDPTSLDWFNYDPATALTTAGSAAPIVSGGLITGITEIGLLVELNVSGGGNAFRIDSYEVDAQFDSELPIPEPASAALFIIGALAIASPARRNRARA